MNEVEVVDDPLTTSDGSDSIDISYNLKDIIDGSAFTREQDNYIILSMVTKNDGDKELSEMVTFDVMRQIYEVPEDNRYYVEKPADLVMPLTFKFPYTKRNEGQYPKNLFSTLCRSRQSPRDPWEALPTKIGKCKAKSEDTAEGEGIFTCCTDHLT
jgi:hypothetical protein